MSVDVIFVLWSYGALVELRPVSRPTRSTAQIAAADSFGFPGQTILHFAELCSPTADCTWEDRHTNLPWKLTRTAPSFVHDQQRSQSSSLLFLEGFTSWKPLAWSPSQEASLQLLAAPKQLCSAWLRWERPQDMSELPFMPIPLSPLSNFIISSSFYPPLSATPPRVPLPWNTSMACNSRCWNVAVCTRRRREASVLGGLFGPQNLKREKMSQKMPKPSSFTKPKKNYQNTKLNYWIHNQIFIHPWCSETHKCQKTHCKSHSGDIPCSYSIALDDKKHCVQHVQPHHLHLCTSLGPPGVPSNLGTTGPPLNLASVDIMAFLGSETHPKQNVKATKVLQKFWTFFRINFHLHLHVCYQFLTLWYRKCYLRTCLKTTKAICLPVGHQLPQLQAFPHPWNSSKGRWSLFLSKSSIITWLQCAHAFQ